MARLAGRGPDSALKAKMQRRLDSKLFDAPGFVRELAVGLHAATDLRILGRANMNLIVHARPGVADARAEPTERAEPAGHAEPIERSDQTELAVGAVAQDAQFELWAA